MKLMPATSTCRHIDNLTWQRVGWSPMFVNSSCATERLLDLRCNTQKLQKFIRAICQTLVCFTKCMTDARPLEIPYSILLNNRSNVSMNLPQRLRI